MSVSLSILSAEQRAILAEEIARYKTLRPILRNSRMYRLLPQTDLIAPPHLQPPGEPDAVEFYDPALKQGIVFFFQGAADWGSRVVVLKGLEPEAIYRVESSDRPLSAQCSGWQLMTDGLTLTCDAGRPSAIVCIKPAAYGELTLH